MNRQQRATYVAALLVIAVCGVSTPGMAQDCPELVGRWPYGPAYGVAVSGDFAYVADGDGGLRVIDVSTVSDPVEAGFFDTPGLAWGVAASGGYIHVADYDAGVEIFQVCPEWPFADGFESGDTSAWSATVP